VGGKGEKGKGKRGLHTKVILQVRGRRGAQIEQISKLVLHRWRALLARDRNGRRRKKRDAY
jgi:hypothetical protein